MSKIKENPIKFVQLFSIIYLVAYAILRVAYNIVVSAVYELLCFDVFEILGIVISLIPITLFLVYTYKFYGTKKTQILLPISYIVSLALSLFSFIQTIGYSRNYTLYILFGHTIAAVLTFILKVIGLGISVFLLVDCFTNFKYLKTSKKLVIIGAFISFVPPDHYAAGKKGQKRERGYLQGDFLYLCGHGDSCHLKLRSLQY